MKTENQDHIFIRNLLLGKECSPKYIEIVLNLIDKFFSYSKTISNFF